MNRLDRAVCRLVLLLQWTAKKERRVMHMHLVESLECIYL